MIEPKTRTMEERLKKIRAEDIMSKFAITTTEDTRISDLAHLMMRFKISGIPVIKDGKICGIVSATDLFNLMGKIIKEIGRGRAPDDYYATPVKELMTSNVISVQKDMNLTEIMKIMTGYNIHTLPVMESDKIIGIIGRRDVINACFFEAFEESKVKDERKANAK